MTDTLHDGLGGAIWFMTEAYLRSPVVSPQVADTARRIRATFIPALNELNATYATEAHAALQRKELLEQHRDALESLPVAENKTMFDWTKAFVEAGERLHQLLSDRADAAEGSRKEAGALRAGTIGMLNRLRGTLADEVEHDPALPRDLDDQVFGYFDVKNLARRRGGLPSGNAWTRSASASGVSRSRSASGVKNSCASSKRLWPLRSSRPLLPRPNRSRVGAALL